MSKKGTGTSWGGVADWYGDHIEGDDTYHAQVVAPNIVRLVAPTNGMRLLDIGCGEGYFSRLFADAGAIVTGTDISPELIAIAHEKERGKKQRITYHVAPAEDMACIPDASCDVVTAVLTMQNMEHFNRVCKEVARVLTPHGRVVVVLNHPAFRIPKESSWGWDREDGVPGGGVQYRRVDTYLTPYKAAIDMHPGAKTGDVTYSFHRSLQDHMKGFAKAGLAITRLEEWISHRKSEPGPRQRAEDIARKEIPLFLALELRPIHIT
jgi:SAM-dependent methyltransferase